MKRQPYRAGSFYEAQQQACLRSVESLLAAAEPPIDLPDPLYGGLVPHAGWMFSGSTAAATFKALARRNRLTQLVIFGADHWGTAGGAAVFDTGSWVTPLGQVDVDADLAGALCEAVPALRPDVAAHAREHSIEVQLPILQVLQPQARIVPIDISPAAEAVAIGRAVGEVLQARYPNAAVIGSTDLTHYGPQYDFTPGGTGRAGLDWAMHNDRRVLQLIEAMRADEIVPETQAHKNACGGGAVAATLAACAAMGATRGIVLQHTSSAEIMQRLYRSHTDDSVGYAAVVFG